MTYDTDRTLPEHCQCCGYAPLRGPLRWTEMPDGDEQAMCRVCASQLEAAHDARQAARDEHLADLADQDDDEAVSDGPQWFDDEECSDWAAEEE